MFNLFTRRAPATPTESTAPGVSVATDQPEFNPKMPGIHYTPEPEPAAKPKPPLSSHVLADAATAIAAGDESKRQATLAFAVRVARGEVDATAAAEFCRQHGATPEALDQLVGAFGRRETLIHEAGQLDRHQRDDAAHMKVVVALQQEVADLKAAIKRKENDINILTNDARVAGQNARACRAARVRLEREAELKQFNDAAPLPAEVANQPNW